MRRAVGKPRVVLVAHGIHDAGGMERAFAELVRRLHERYDLVVVSSDLADDLRDLVTWRRVHVPRRPVPLRLALFYVLAAVRLATTRRDVLHTLGAIVPNAVDVASVHCCFAGFVAAMGGLAPPGSPRLRRLNTALANGLALLAERWTYRPRRARMLAPVSRGVTRELQRYYPDVPAARAPNGVDAERFRPDPATRAEVRRSAGVEADEVLALFLGGDWERKGLPLAIEAVARARRESGAPIRLLVVGRGDAQRHRARAAELGIAEHVLFTGPRRDPERFCAAADMLVLPTWYETFSLVAYEAAATGLPVIATRVHGVEDLVGDGAAGRIVARDAAEIAAALAELAASRALRAELGAAARERASAYTWDRSGAAIEAIYRSLVRDAAPGREAVEA